MLVGVDWLERVHERCERLLLTLIHIWVDWIRHPGDIPVDLPGHLGIYQCCPRRSRGTRVIILWFATQAQRDHKIIPAKNFRV